MTHAFIYYTIVASNGIKTKQIKCNNFNLKIQKNQQIKMQSMKNKKVHFLKALFLLGLGSVFAQQSTVSAGGNATGSNGSVSYSVGQTVYTTATGSNGSMAQGVQQPYEIQTVLGRENFNINLQMAVYPNPTVNFLSLEIRNYNFENVQYQLYDLNGRLIATSKVASDTTTIAMEHYPSAIYFLKVVNNNTEIKTFKIIKN